MIQHLDKESLRVACFALRTAIERRAHGDVESMRAPLRALTGLEHAAFNAPQNKGWLRERQIELRNTLGAFGKRVFSDVDDLQVLYRDIASILQSEPHQAAALAAKSWFVGAKF